jgi:hypothetical protein
MQHNPTHPVDVTPDMMQGWVDRHKPVVAEMLYDPTKKRITSKKERQYDAK